jgi:hypothetical protein
MYRKIVGLTNFIKCRFGTLVWLCFAFIATAGTAADEKVRIEAPQVFDARGEFVGLYGGLVPVTSIQGETVNAIAVVTRKGYLLPMTPQGEVGLFRSAYFADEACGGDEYLSPVADLWGSAPLAGLIYRSLATAQIRYIPQYSAAVPIEVKSRMYFDDQNVLKCEALDTVVRVLQSDENDPAITGYRQRQTEQRAVALRIPESTRRQARSISQRFSEGATLKLEPDDDRPGQQECSPGCLWEDTGNDICEISCYVEGCYFDSGDCANETAEFLEKELAQCYLVPAKAMRHARKATRRVSGILTASRVIPISEPFGKLILVK